MKKIMPLLIMIVLFVGLILSGCGSNGLSVPDADATVYGNGGNVVSCGDYVYYINGYESYSTLEALNKNVLGDVEISAIYRAKIVAGEFTDVQMLVSKVAGFENGSLFIVGNYLYFSSPTTKKDGEGQVRYDLLTFFKIKLDGTGLSEVYTTESYSSGKFCVVNYLSKKYLLIYTGSSIVKVDLDNNSVTTLVSTGVTSVLFCEDVSYSILSEQNNVLNGNLNGYIYYTRSRNESEGSEESVAGNIFEKVNFTTNAVSLISSNVGDEITLKYISGERIYYTIGSTYYSTDLTTANNNVQHCFAEYTNFYPLGKDEQGNQKGFLIEYNSKMYYQAYGSVTPSTTPLIEESVTYLFENDYYVYYFSNDEIRRINILSLEDDLIAGEFGTLNTSLIVDCDFDGRFVYFVTKPESSESNQYLFVADTNAGVSDETRVFVAGVMQTEDIPDEEETEE